MEFIIDFYKSLDILNLIIFWGIIVVIILLLIFSFILINKNKKLKSLIEKNNDLEDLPIKKEEAIHQKFPEDSQKVQKNNFLEKTVNEPLREEKNEKEIITKPLETEKKFIAEEHVMEYNQDLLSLSNVKKNNEYKEEVSKYETKTTSSIQKPTGPYQRNVLREMSLSQTSPIGITKPIQKETKKIEIAKDLEQSLNNETIISQNELNNTNNILSQNTEIKLNNQIKKELTNIKNTSPRKTEIISEKEMLNKTVKYEQKNTTQEEQKINKINYIDMINTETPAKELLNLQPQISKEKNEKTSSEKYLEEVSKKLARAEVTDEIERTNYELKQEEDAIISYKELMQKKDSIQTIDEEDVVISIEELMNRNQKKKEQFEQNTKLYNLSEEEENDNFIKELKQFRNDL